MTLRLLLILIPTLTFANTVTLDQSTTLLDNTTFTEGVTYLAAFQLNSAGFANSQANLALFALNSGTGVAQNGGDPVSGLYTFGPNTALASGIWQPGGTLSLTVDPVNGYALYTQAFIAGTTFSFDFDLQTDLPDGFTPDQFTFQLYDPGISNLLYQVSQDALQATATPEPGTFALFAAVFALLAGFVPKCAGAAQSVTGRQQR